MKRRIVSLILAAAASVALSMPASALCLVWDPSAATGWRDDSNGYRSMPVDTEFDRALMVVTAKVRSIRGIGDGDTIVARKFEVAPTETIKGPQLDAFTVFEWNDSGRYEMDVGKTYLLFVTAMKGKRSTVSACGWSDEVSKAGETLQRVRTLAAG